MNEVEILKWAAGAPVDVSQIAQVDEEKLLALLWQHRLYQRLAARVEAGKPHWYSRKLGIGVWTQCRRARAGLERQLAALREIKTALNAAGTSSDQPLMTIKGFSVYALTGDQRHLTFSGDIDLLSPDPKRLLTVLERLGYSGEKQNEDDPDYHEIAVMHRGDITIELHRFFRVWSYPEGLTGANLIPAQNPSRWLQEFGPIRERRIEYEDLVEHAVPGIAPSLEHSMVPDVTMTVLILCAHAFTHFLGPPAWHVRLGELASISHLARDPQFNQQRFLELAERFCAFDALDFIDARLREYFGDNPLPQRITPADGLRRQREESINSPVRLSYFGGWASCISSEELLLPDHSRPIIGRLGASLITAAAGPERRVYTTTDGGEPLARFIAGGSSGKILPIRISVAHDEETFTFRVYLPERVPDDEEYQVVLHDDNGFENATWCTFEHQEAAVLFTDSSGRTKKWEVIYYTEGQDCSVERLAVQEFVHGEALAGQYLERSVRCLKAPDASEQERPLFMMLVVAKRNKAVRQEEPKEFAILPLRIIRD